MIFAEAPLDQALGAWLAHGRLIGGQRWSKGRLLSAEDLALAAAAGIDRLTIARLSPDDVPEDEAAARLGAALAGPHLRALPATHGRCNLAATADGLLMLDAAAIHSVNAIDEAMTLGTLPAFARVAAGEIVATVKIIRYAVGAPMLARAITVAAPLAVHPFRPITATLFSTRLPGLTDKAMAKTLRVTRARIEALGGTLATERPLPHAPEPLASALGGATADLILVAGASASVDRGDVVPMAILQAGGVVERLGMPVDPGNLLVLGRIGARPVIGLPGCARSPKRNGLDLVLERLAAGLGVSGADIAMMGVGGLLPEAERPDPQPR